LKKVCQIVFLVEDNLCPVIQKALRSGKGRRL